MKNEAIPTSYPREWVENAHSLKKAITAIHKSDTIYFDLEADSMHHYFAKICLMQILANGTCYLIDPLSEMDMGPLLSALEKKFMVLHGADYDLRMLFHQHGFRPKKIFDTMIAAQLLGRKAFGLAALIKENFEVVIDKEEQKADWSRRPLSDSMLAYAAQDTHFLPGLHFALSEELKAKDRFSWHEESCEALIATTMKTREVDPDSQWRIQGSSKLHSRQLAALKAVWEVREEEAQKTDIPPFKIMPSEILLRMAEAVPKEGRPELSVKMPSRLHSELKSKFLLAYEEAFLSPRQQWPLLKKPSKKPIKGHDPVLLEEMKRIRDLVAKGLDLDPSLLAPRAVLSAVATTDLISPEKIREAAKWLNWQENLLLNPWLQIGQSTKEPS